MRCVHVAKEDFYAEGGVRVSNEDAATAVQGMKQSVAAGELWLESPEVAAKCADHCDALANDVMKHVLDLQALASLPGFGGFASGLDLQTGFEGKANEAMEHLKSYAAVASRLADTFRSAGAAYSSQDSSTEASLGGIGGDMLDGRP